MTTAVSPVCRPHAALVDDLRAKLPPQYMHLAAICTLLAISDTTRPDDSEVLAALLYLERRGEVQRRSHYGWRKINTGDKGSLANAADAGRKCSGESSPAADRIRYVAGQVPSTRPAPLFREE